MKNMKLLLFSFLGLLLFLGSPATAAVHEKSNQTEFLIVHSVSKHCALTAVDAVSIPREQVCHLLVTRQIWSDLIIDFKIVNPVKICEVEENSLFLKSESDKIKKNPEPNLLSKRKKPNK